MEIISGFLNCLSLLISECIWNYSADRFQNSSALTEIIEFSLSGSWLYIEPFCIFFVFYAEFAKI